jgi:class 3 adenylate cyclase
VAGYVSTKERVELTVVGDTVNVASGLQALARPNRILIGPQTAAAVAKFKPESIGPQQIKDRAQPIEVFEVKA